MDKLITRWLPVKLTREEREVRASDLAATMNDRELKESEHKSLVAMQKSAIAKLDAKIRDLRECVRTNEELRTVECYEVARPAERMVDILRSDTHVVVDTREMTDLERQGVLSFEKPATDTIDAPARTAPFGDEPEPKKQKRTPKRRQSGGAR